MERLSIAALVTFATGALCGVLVTALAPMSLTNWYYFVGARILWQLGSSVWLGAALAMELGAPRALGAALGGLLGLLLCVNPVLDALRGPLVVEGRLVRDLTRRGKVIRSGGGSSPTIHAELAVQAADGEIHRLSPAGLQANRWQYMSAGCLDPSDKIRVVALRHLGAVLEVHCTHATGTPENR